MNSLMTACGRIESSRSKSGNLLFFMLLQVQLDQKLLQVQSRDSGRNSEWSRFIYSASENQGRRRKISPRPVRIPRAWDLQLQCDQ